jgi:hypothetical protein
VRALSEPSRLAAAVFLLLIAATIGAFFAAQRLKHQDPLLRYRASDRAFSPNDDGIKDTARIRFRLPEADDVTVTILDEDGGAVARVARPFAHQHADAVLGRPRGPRAVDGGVGLGLGGVRAADRGHRRFLLCGCGTRR